MLSIFDIAKMTNLQLKIHDKQNWFLKGEQHVVAVDVELCWKCNKDNDEAYWKYKRLSGVPKQKYSASCVQI